MQISVGGLVIYLGIGALFHIVFVGPTFVWSSAWTWLLLFGWPLLVAIVIFLASLAIAAWERR